MNLDEKSIINNCQEKNVKDTVSKRRSEEFLSPTRRSSRIRKPKISDDYCKIDNALESTSIITKGKELLVESLVDPSSINTKRKENYGDSDKRNEVTNSNQFIKTNCSPFEINSDDGESLNSMFDDIFGQQYTKTLKALLPPQKLQSDSIKERNFFRRKSLETPKQSFSNYTINKTNLPAEDVSKVFKIISKPNILSEKLLDSKSDSKPTLKTYSNKRKKFQCGSVVESFGLPDYPIISENIIKPSTTNKLDAEILDVSEITLLDLQYINEPWIITNVEGESLFPYYEEVRIKAEPDYFRINGSFLDIDTDNFETYDLDFFTSTPKKKIVNNDVNPYTNSTPKNSKLSLKSREIDIEAIKMNFKKMLSKKVEEVDVNIKGIVSQKKKRITKRSRNMKSACNEMSFVKNDSLTLGNKEIEISNNLSVLENTEKNVLYTFGNATIDVSKRKSPNCRKKICRSTKVPLEPVGKIKTKVKKKLTSNVHQLINPKKQLKMAKRKKKKLRIKFKNPPKNKKPLKHSNCINELSEIIIKNVERKAPKKKSTKIDSKKMCCNCSIKSVINEEKEKCLEKQKDIGLCNEESKNFVIDNHFYRNHTDKKDLIQLLDNRWNLMLENVNNCEINQVNGTRELTNIFIQNEKVSHGSKEELLNSLIKNQTNQLEVLEINMKSNIQFEVTSKTNFTKTERQFLKAKLIENELRKSDPFNTNTTGKRLLRSSSQENIATASLEKNNSNVERRETGNCKLQKGTITGLSPNANAKKYKFKTDFNNLISVRNEEETVEILNTVNKIIERRLIISEGCKANKSNSNKNLCKNVDHKMENRNHVPELKIIITPLDLSQLCNKVPNTINEELVEVNRLSPTTRKLRSSSSCRTVVCNDTKLNQNVEPNLLIVENCNENKLATSVVLKPDVLDTESNSSGIIKPDSSSNCDQVKVFESRSNIKEGFVNSIENGTILQLNNSSTKNMSVNIDLPGAKFQKDATIKKNITKNDYIQCILPKNEVDKHKISEKVENKSLAGLDLPKLHKIGKHTNVYDKHEPINTQNCTGSLNNESEILKLLSTVVPCDSHVLKGDEVKNDRIKEYAIEEAVVSNVTNDVSYVFCKESKLHFPHENLESMNIKLDKHSYKSEIIPEMLKNANTDNREQENAANHTSAIQNKSATMKSSFINFELTDKRDTTCIPQEIKECIEFNQEEHSKKDGLVEVDGISTIDAVEISEIKQKENRLTTGYVTVCEKSETQVNSDIQTIEVNLASENIEDNIVQCCLGQKGESKLIIAQNSQLLEESVNNDFILACPKEPVKQLTDTDKVTLTEAFSDHVTKKDILKKSSTAKINVLPRDGSRRNEEGQNKIRYRPSRRKSVDHIEVSNKEKEEYRNRLRRSKSVAPCSRNDIRVTRKINKVDTYNNHSIQEAEKNIETHRSKLRRSKSFTNAISHSGNKSKGHRDINTSGDLKQNEENIKYKRKSNENDCNKLYAPSLDIQDKDKLNTKTAKSSLYIANMGGKCPEFQVGDLAWGQIGSHPFWPCLVIGEPETGRHKKIVAGRGSRVLYHVRFFGDNGRRAWVNKNQLMSYNNSNDLQVLMDKLRNEKKFSLLRPLYVRSNNHEKWQSAVNEAERLKSKNLKKKLLFFRNVFKSPTNKKSRSNDDVIRKESLKRKCKEIVSQNENNQELKSVADNSSPVHKKFKKRLSDNTNIVSENAEIKQSKTEVVASEIIYKDDNDSFTSSNNKSCSGLQLKDQTDEILEISSKASSDNSPNTLLYTMESQKDLFKRNNLFKGVSRDKVCQYCLKPGEVLKCRGRCNGSYHVDCATKIVKERTVKKRKERSINKMNFANEKDNDIISPEKPSKSDLCEININSKIPKFLNYDYNLRHTNGDKSNEISNREVEVTDKIQLKPEDHVQIITVPSSVYNTPPRKTFPPDFKNMTLAEQIDYKMKEIMKKFESKTFYAESSIDSSSEENSVYQSQTNTKQFNRCRTLFPVDEVISTEVDKPINKKTEGHEEMRELEIIKSNDTDNTCNSISTFMDTPILNNNKDPKKSELTIQKSSVKHVTADCDTESIDDVSESRLNINETFTEVGTIVDPKHFKCGFCISNSDPFCFICNHSVSKKGSNIRQKCSLYQCGRFYHPECLKLWPQTQWSLIQTTKHKDSDQAVDSFVCPLHVCHTCASDDPRAATSRCSGDKIVKCLRCPSTYHSTNLCVPAGTSIFSSTQIVCPRHRERNKLITINTTWCFLCSEGGNLICCETCPTSVHPECLPVNLTDDDKFICEDCESGRLPLYDEIVWVKLGRFRWWPALILFPNEVPANILNIKHTTGEFVVKFFGTYDYYWVNRGRSFLFQEGDTGQCNSVKKKVDAAFNTAVEEAVVAHKLKKEFKLTQEAESITSLKPPPYIRIKVNKPVGNVRQLDLDLSSTTACECDPSQPHPCGPDSDCLNRLLLTECSPDVCPAGKRCKNQSFEKREYPPLVPYKTQGRGWGLKTLAPIKKGQFVIEYVGELIDIEEYQRRIQKMHEQKEENYYFLTIDKDRMLDAGPKGNAARFMNHCCQPNCETQKWTVNGDTRVGLFATEDIPVDTELTFNYNLECVGKEKKVCRCGAPNCSGFIGVKAKQDTDFKKPKKPSHKKKKPTERIVLPPCFICGRRGNVNVCNNKICNKTYHLRCLQMTEWPEGNKFICPWHNCNICSKRTIRCCVKCVNSFCPSHSEGNIRYDNLLGFVCGNHDPMKISNEEPIKLRKKRNTIMTDESAVTSTTSDDIEDKDDIPLLLRYLKYRRNARKELFDSESESECNISKDSIFKLQEKQRNSSDYDSQDEGVISSVTVTDGEDDNSTRKRVRRQRQCQPKKKFITCSLQGHNNTAICSLKNNSIRKDCSSELISSNGLENR